MKLREIMRRRKKEILIVGTMLVLMLTSCIIVTQQNLMIGSTLTDVTLSEVCMGMLILLMVCALSSSYRRKANAKYFYALVMSAFTSNLLSSFLFAFQYNVEDVHGLAIMKTFVYLISIVYWAAFWMYLNSNRPYRGKVTVLGTIFQIGIAAAFVVLALDIFFPIVTDVVDNEGVDLYPVFATAFYIGLYLDCFLYIVFSKLTLREKLAMCSFIVLPLLCVVAFMKYLLEGNGYFLDSLSSMSSAFSLYMIFFNIVQEQGRKLEQREYELAETRSNAMLLQINPHFIANTLNSIVALCRFDPAEAEKLTVRFAKYLRENYTDLTSAPLTTFEKELDSIENYVAIEKVRFPNLKIVYDIEAWDFMIPTLTIQPLVENAIRHGLNGADGTVHIRSYETDTDYCVCIEDNGMGFDKLPEDGEKHIGIANARARLQMLCGGTLELRSAPGEGTRCRILLPKKVENNESDMY